MEAQSLDAAQRTLCFKSLNAVKLHGQEELTIRNPEEPEDDIVVEDTEEAFHRVQPTRKRRKGNAEARTATLGENPKEARATLRSQLEQGYYLCLSCKNSVSWASVIFSQEWTTWTTLTTELLFRGPLLTIAFVDYALAKGSQTRATHRVRSPPRVRLLTVSD